MLYTYRYFSPSRQIWVRVRCLNITALLVYAKFHGDFITPLSVSRC